METILYSNHTIYIRSYYIRSYYIRYYIRIIFYKCFHELHFYNSIYIDFLTYEIFLNEK